MSVLIPAYKDFKQERQIGEHTILLPDPPDLNKIHYRDLPKEQQFFRRTYLPNNWSTMPKDDRNEFANWQWDIRGREGEKGEGFWFWNNGKLEWMSPNHYFYCNWWRIGKVQIPKEYFSDARDVYYPFFTDADRDWHYLADYCFDDPSCGGLFSIEFRRGGKTYRMGCYQYEKVSKTHDAKGGTQSRNDTDSYNVFEKVIFGWRNLPPFFKPTDIGNSNPVTSLVFDEPKKINTKSAQKVYSDILHSWIDYGNAKEGYYDGKEQLVNIQDEIGKIEQKTGIDLLERIRVVVECCYIMGKKVGIILASTTVEEMEKKGGKQAKDLWIRSTTIDNEARRYPEIFAKGTALNQSGFTVSKLKRYFRPSYYGYLGDDGKGTFFVDRYGYSRTELAKAHLIAERENRQGADLAALKRKFPIVVEDCWTSDIKKSAFDTTRIEDQLMHNEMLLPGSSNGELHYPVKGNFYWIEKNKEAGFAPDDNGRWMVTWLPPHKDRNRHYIDEDGYQNPACRDTGCFGLDPYDHRVTAYNNKSDAASYGVRKYDVLNPSMSMVPVTEYLCRTTPETMYDDIAKQCVFFGWEVFAENQKPGCVNHFIMNGLDRYLGNTIAEREDEYWHDETKKNRTYGISLSGTEARGQLMETVESYVYRYVGKLENGIFGKCYFNNLLNQLKDMEHGDDWTKYDAFVGFGLALLGCKRFTPKEEKPQLIDMFPKYRIDGHQSYRI